MNTEGINIPIGTSFDDKGIITAEQAFGKFGNNINSTLKRLGSDKSMEQLGDSVQAAFDKGLKGSAALLKRFNTTRQQALRAIQEVDRLTGALEKQKKATDEVRDKMSSVDNPEAQQAMKRLMSPAEKKTFTQYQDVRKDSEEQNQRYTNFKKENQAALEGLEIQKQFAGYYQLEKKLVADKLDYEEKYNKMVQAHSAQQSEYFKSHGIKDAKAMYDKGLAWDTKGNPTELLKGYQELSAKQNKENFALIDKIPKVSQKLEDLRLEMGKFMETYRSQLEKFDQHFGERSFVEQVKTLQKWLSQLSYHRLETSADGVRRLTSETVEEEQRLQAIAQDAGEEYRMMREIIKEIFNSHVEETEEVKEQVKLEEQKTQELKTQQGLRDANVKEMESQGTTAQTAVENNSSISDASNYKDALKQVFSWQRVYTIIGKIVTGIGDKMQDLSRKTLGVLVNIGKLGVGMMKAFGSGIVKGATTISSKIKEMKSHFKDSLPTLQQLSKFLVKYIFGFRTMYFLVRKVRQAVGDGIKEIAKADKDVNKSISALKTALNQLKGQLGASFAPIIQPVCSLLVQVINLATKAAVQIGVFLATLTGKDTIKIATAKEVDYAKSLDKTSGSAKKAAKAIKAYLSPLDELNRMDDPNKDSGGGAGGGNGNNDDLGITYKDVKVDKFGISDFAKKLKEAWKNQDWEGVGKVISDKLGEVFGKISDFLSWENLEKKIGKFTDIVSGIINGISKNEKMWENLGKAIGNGITTAIKTVNQLVRKIKWSDIGSAIATSLGNAIKKIQPEDVAQFLENKFIAIFDTLNGFMNKMKKNKTWKEIATKVVKAINGADWYGIAIKIFTFAGNLFSAVRDVILGFISQSGFSEFADKLASAINDSVGKLKPEDFKQAGIALSSAITTLLGNVGKLIKSTSGSGQKFLDGIKEFFNGINWESVLTDAGDIASSLANGLIEVFGTLGEILNKQDESGVSLAQKIGTKIGEAIKKVDFTALGQAFGNFGEAVIEGIMAAIQASDFPKKFQEFMSGVFSTRSPLLQTLITATPWLAFVGAIIKGIGKAIPLVLSANQATGGKLGQAIANWFSGSGTGAAASGGSGAGTAAVAGTAGKGVSAKAVGAAAWNIAAVGTAIAGVKTTITGCTDAWNLMTGKMTEADFGGINTKVKTFGDGLKNVATDSNQARLTMAYGFQTVGDGIANVINKGQSLFTGVDKFTGKEVPSIKGAFKTVGDGVANIINKGQGLFTGVDKFTGEKVPSIKGAFEGIGKKFGEVKDGLGKGMENIKGFWSSGMEKLKEGASNAWGGIKGVFGKVGDWFKEKFQGAWQNVKDVFSTGGEIFSGIKEGIEKTFKKIVNKIIDGINKIIKKPFDAINDMIDKLRGISIAGFKPFANFKNFNVPQIPKLAQGAVIPASKPFLAMLGDQKSGKNLEAPESLIRQIVREEAGGNNGKTTVVAKVGRRELFEIILEEAKIRQQTTGRNPFEFT